jgi:hypothetical protein
MRFVLTMNMPVRGKANMRHETVTPHLVHQIIADHPAKSLDEFRVVLSDNPFVIFEELYKDIERGGYFSVGRVIVNSDYVGKVKELTNNRIENMRNQGE